VNFATSHWLKVFLKANVMINKYLLVLQVHC
jgi:hypothetical protein